MSEYIDKQAFNDELAKLVPWAIETSADNAYTQGLNDAHCALLDFPAADVAPVIHARWEEYGLMWRCSRCRVEHMPPFVKTAYCPHCGARMDA